MIDTKTFGKTPAAEQLVRQLNEIQHQPTIRSVSIAIKTFNDNVKSILDAVDLDAMTAKVASNLLRLLRQEAQTINIQAYDVHGCTTEYITNLTKNVVIGNIKRAIRSITVIRKIQNSNTTLAKVKSKASNNVISATDYVVSYQILGYRAGYSVGQRKTQHEWVPDYPRSSEVAEVVTSEMLHARSQARRARKQQA
ncbi:hypothetical protein UFOVP116_235 [uncultured Caudovirales phage]|uniref:Uncharacterized protein n=1 Tax=uncultured Caudovirales phage TaxID=2100421 RepID=A0A6J5L6L4_9CAUD|nr:hypothetical protein UFOVP116_235 [uncultured Caudovirales phage]